MSTVRRSRTCRPGAGWTASIADDLPAKRLSRLYSTNHYIVSMVNPVATPFLSGGGRERSQMARALGALGIGVSREVLNFYRGIVQRKGDTWPRFNMLMNGVHALIDQEYSGDINIIPSFRWYNPAKILSHLSEKELMDLMEGGERSAYPHDRDDSHLHAHLAHDGGNSAPLRVRRSASRRRGIPSTAGVAATPGPDPRRPRGSARDRGPRGPARR
jgi:hypothetical protein